LRKYLFLPLILLAGLIIANCSSVDVAKKGDIKKSATILVLPFENNTETPYAGIRAARITEGILAKHGFNVIPNEYGQKDYTTREINEMEEEAKRNGYRYVVRGSVNEWRYKTGIDGEPAVSITLTVKDLSTGAPIFSGVASKSGLGYSSIGVLAQDLINDMVSSLKK